MRYAMAIDTNRCFGCQNCAVLCKSANNLPRNVWWNKVVTVGGDEMDTATGTYPNNTLSYYTKACQHCEQALCVAVCPTGASIKREDGIVWVDNEVCIGCKACIEACPYDVRTLIEGEPEYYFDFATGDLDAEPHKNGTVEKCDFCAHRIDKGGTPACMEICNGRARYFGDIDDPQSEISKLLASRDYYCLMEEEKTSPSVFMLT